jgi:hypothetical protein
MTQNIDEHRDDDTRPTDAAGTTETPPDPPRSANASRSS